MESAEGKEYTLPKIASDQVANDPHNISYKRQKRAAYIQSVRSIEQ